MKKTFLYLTVFVSGMAVMAVELTASRLIAPYFGTSLFVWTNLIGVVLIALSLGYYLGGRLADRNGGRNARQHLFLLIFATGILIGAVPFIAEPVFRFAYETMPRRDLSIFLPSLVSIFLLFTLPLLFLGMVTPLAARIGIGEMDSAGRTIGSLYAFSTAGSILGTFLPVLLTIPFWGSRETFYIFGGLLILWGGLGLGRPLLSLVVCLPIAWTLVASKERIGPDIEFQKESIYNLVRVQKLPGDFRTLIVNEGIGAQSVYHPSHFLTGLYWDGAALLPSLNPEGKNFLFVGLAGGTSARLVSHFFPDLGLEGVEIDPVIAEVGRRWFGLGEIPIRIQVGDGRTFLERTDGSYDFIMVDVYHDNFFIPFHLATKEFFETVRSRLTPKGAMVINVFSPSPDSDILRLLKNTVSSVFPVTYEFRVHDIGSLLYAFREPPDLTSASRNELPADLKGLNDSILRQWKPVAFDPSIGLSRDDKPTVEFLSAKSIFLRMPNIKPYPFSSE